VILAAQSPYAVGIQQVFQAEFERHGGDVLEILEFPENTSDFSGLLDRVMTLKPDCVYLAAYADEVAAMIRGLRELEYPGTILTTSAFATAGAMSATGAQATGVFLTQSAFETRSEEPAVQAFVEAYQAQHGAEPDIYAAHGYDALKVLATALGDVALAGDVWKALRGVRDFVGATGPIQFDERGDVGKFPRVYVIDRSGQLLNYEGEVARRREEILKRIRELQQERQQATPPSGR
jgi:branched-chain amino acid transport system substrate-binding protein